MWLTNNMMVRCEPIRHSRLAVAEVKGIQQAGLGGEPRSAVPIEQCDRSTHCNEFGDEEVPKCLTASPYGRRNAALPRRFVRKSSGWTCDDRVASLTAVLIHGSDYYMYMYVQTAHQQPTFRLSAPCCAILPLWPCPLLLTDATLARSRVEDCVVRRSSRHSSLLTSGNSVLRASPRQSEVEGKGEAAVRRLLVQIRQGNGRAASA